MFTHIRSRFRWDGSVNVLGVRVDPTNMDAAVRTIIAWSENPGPCCRYVCVTGMHGVIESQSDHTMREILSTADLNVPDGMPLSWLGWFAGFEEMDRVFGPELMLRVCAASVGKEISHFLYGGNDGVADALAARLATMYPGLRIAGTYCPPFRALTGEEANEVVRVINGSGASIVWVGLSTPKQERWMSAFAPRLTAGVTLGVGAAFDYNTGHLKRAPVAMQRAGLEWLFRLIQEPRRLFGRYARSIPKFIVLVAQQAVSSWGWESP
ncbi:MAG: WecB/TagA/CpsF family glycosyltransferase [Ignavibacteriae bacterium]|nr:WecB/TagA/CpsF family glycosyltransferase [Ignavibacteriota bacterium]